MCPGETDDFATNESNEPTNSLSIEPTEDVTNAEVEATPKAPWSRRTFLKAAALGAAASAFVGRDSAGRLGFGAAAALADNTGTDLLFSGFQCTAGDVTLISARTLNEPCDCVPGTLRDQEVEFTLRNTATSARSCIVLHLCPTTLPDGSTFDPDDVILPGVIQNQETKTFTAIIPNYPCGAGTLCFGPVVAPTGRCTGCCSTVSYNVPGDGETTCPNPTPTRSKCKHQQICIVGRGITTLDCNTSTSGVQTNCPVQCGSNATLRLCTTSPASFGPFTFTLNGQSFGPTTDTCHDFTVGPITADTEFTGTVTDDSGCAASASATVTTAAVATPVLTGALNAGCTGSATFTVTNCVQTLTYTYQEVDCTTGASIGPSQGGLGVCSATFTFAPGATNATHCVRVTASNGSAACDQPAQASVTIPAVVSATLALQGTPGCNGVVTLLATASGGVAPYTFVFNGATGTVSGSGDTRTIVIQPILDGSCRSVTVTVTDSRGCSATSSAVSFSTCATTTLNC